MDVSLIFSRNKKRFTVMVKLMFSTTGMHGNHDLFDLEMYNSNIICLPLLIKQWITNTVDKYKEGKFIKDIHRLDKEELGNLIK